MLDIMLKEFPFASLWNMGIFLFSGFFVVIYLFILPQEKKHPIWKSIVFFLGLLVVFISTGSPLNIIGRIQFSTHIIQVVLLCLIAPPLLIIGMKKKVFQLASKVSIVEKVMSILTRPYVAIILFLLALYTYHHPPIFDQARVDLYDNYLYLFLLFFTAILLWVSLLSANVSEKMRQIYHLICIVGIIPLSGILLFSKDVLYTAYTDMTTFSQALQVCLPPGQTISPELVLLLLPFEPIGEQHLGGMILLGTAIVVFLISIFMNRGTVPFKYKKMT